MVGAMTQFPDEVKLEPLATYRVDAATQRRASVYVAGRVPRSEVLGILAMLGLMEAPPRTRPVARDGLGRRTA